MSLILDKLINFKKEKLKTNEFFFCL